MTCRRLAFVGLAALAVDTAWATNNCSDVSPVPSGAICRQNGTVTGAKQRGPVAIVGSFDDCLELASQSKKTRSFGWNHVDGECSLYTTSLAAPVKFNASATAPTEFSEKACYTCHPVCPAPLNVNQVSNPGFEASSHFIGPWVSPNVTVVSPGENSTNAASLPNPAALRQSINNICKTGPAYLFTYDYKFSNTSSKAVSTLFHDFFSTKGQTLVNQYSDDWTHYESYQELLFSEVDMAIEYSNNLQDKSLHALIDNVGLYAVDAPVIKPGAQEMIVNGGFETGQFAPWVASGPIKVIKHGLDGSKYAARASPIYPQVAFLYQNVTLVQGSHYLFSFNYSSGSPFSITYTLSTGSSSTPTESLTSFFGTFPPPSKGVYSEARTFVAQDVVNTLAIEFYYGGAEVGHPHVTMDDISIKEIVKPAIAA